MYKPHVCAPEAAKYHSSVVQEKKKIGEVQEPTKMLMQMWDF